MNPDAWSEEFAAELAEAMSVTDSTRLDYLARKAHFNIYFSELWKGTAERFAKAIVEECASRALEWDGNPDIEGTVSECIKRHFGVE
jgi:hypothetical protein